MFAGFFYVGYIYGTSRPSVTLVTTIKHIIIKLSCFLSNNVGKAPQWYSVHEGDATMFIQGSDAWTKKAKKPGLKLRKVKGSEIYGNNTKTGNTGKASMIGIFDFYFQMRKTFL